VPQLLPASLAHVFHGSGDSRLANGEPVPLVVLSSSGVQPQSNAEEGDAYLVATLADIVDAWLKGGWPYIHANGVVVFVYWAAALPVCLVGVRSKSIRIHTFMAVIICVLQLVALFEVFPKLGF
jgi:hypothetical protein